MTFEVFKSKDGTFRWHLREANGRIVELRPGKIKLPPTTSKENRRVREAAQHVLSVIAAESVKA
jgi:hypothetical protein